MKRMIALAVSVALIMVCMLSSLVLPTSADDSPVGLLPAGDFESAPTSGWTWDNHATNAPKYAIISEGNSLMTVVQESDDNHCLEIPEMLSGTTYKVYDKYYKSAPVEAGKKYRLSMKYKGTGLRVYIHTSYSTPGGVYNAPAATDWTDYAAEFTVNETTTNTNFIFAIGHAATAGTAYVDDVQLLEVIEPESIDFAADIVTLGKGEQYALSVTAQPEGAVVDAVSYTSSNTAAATVDTNGVVTAVATGVAYITATMGSYTATATVIVDPYAPVSLGDFEDDTLSGWKYSNATYSILHDQSPMKVFEESKGNHCLHIPATGTDDGQGTITYKSYARYYYKLPVEGNKTYQLSFRYKGDGVAVRKSTSGASTSLPSASDWTTYSMEFTTAASPSTNFIFGVGHQAKAGDGYIDDVTLIEVSPFKELLVDGDLQANSLSSNWSKFTAATANVTHTTDPEDPANRCFKFTGSKVPNYSSISSAKGDTYYMFSFRHKGTGKAQVSFTKNYVDVDSVSVLNTEAYSVSNTESDIRLYIDTKNTWQTINIVFKTTASPNSSWILQFGSNGSTTEIYLDDFSLIELGGVYAQEGLAGGSVSVSNGTDSGVLLGGSLGKTVTVTVTPDEGYLMVPGSLRYLASGGRVFRILNKDTDEFGAGAGNTFAFEMPINNVRILADFVKADTTDFSWGTVGTSVRYNGETMHGIRFLTRVNLAAFDENADGLTLKYEGETYTVSKMGLLLKRTSNTHELTLDNWMAYGASNTLEKVWGIEVYNEVSNQYRLTDFTDTYFDYTIAMVTDTPSDAFNDRLYTARGFLVLEKDGVETVLYATERTDSINTTLARANGEISDEVVGGDNDNTVVESPIPEDDKDYSNADLKILSIGNSYSQDAQAYLAKMAEAEGKTFKCVNLYKAGCALATHATAWATTDPIYNYELGGEAGTDYTAFVSLKSVLESDQFDVITLQQSSWGSVSYSTYQPHLNNLIAAIREKQPNAKIYLQQTWAYGDASSNHTSNPAYTGGSMAAMWQKVETAYNSAASATGLELIPSGQAIQHAQDALNARGLGESIQRDNAHVSKTWGRYLLARVWYQKLTGEIPNVTLPQINSSVAANAAMESLVAQAVADAFAEYPVSLAA